jgi:L-ascorbate metabolism protein UlaG (beta-lactamase superfamily)
MIEPVLKDDALLEDVARARGEPGLHLWWLGQSGFLLQWAGCHVLLDPYLSDSLTQKYAATDKPHIRMTARAVAPERLNFIDVVTASHAHTDHLDADTLRPLAAANPGMALVIPEAIRPLAAERSALPAESLVGLDDGAAADVRGVGFTGVAAAHETLEQDAAGRYVFLGFIVRLGPWTIYHSGDTLRYPGLAERLRPHAPDIALLPINGRAPERRVAGNLNGPEAALLAHDIAARLVIPCHYDMFTFNTASPDPFAAEADRLGQPYRILGCGERFVIGPHPLPPLPRAGEGVRG